MSAFKDLTGKRFGKLEVISFAYSDGACYWNCKCDCGKTTIVRGTNLRAGYTKSCGCGSLEQALKNIDKSRKLNTKHGCSNKEKLYHIWKGMKARCYNPHNKRYKNYGGRGITVCDDWEKDYVNFKNWALNNGYNDNLTIDRIDNNGDYSPENCRWVDAKIQANNTTRNIYIKYKGKIQSLSLWADTFGITYSCMKHRYDRGWSMEKIEKTEQRNAIKRLSKKNN